MVMDFMEAQAMSKSLTRQVRNHIDYWHAQKSVTVTVDPNPRPLTRTLILTNPDNPT